MFLLALGVIASAAPRCELPQGAHCLTLYLHSQQNCTLPRRHRKQGRRPQLEPTDPGQKQVREAGGGSYAHEVETANTVVKWGPDGDITQQQLQHTIDAIDVAWSQEIERMGYPAPLRSDGYKLNIYIGDTGDGAPSSLGAAGYMWTDDEDFPILVLAPDTATDPSEGPLTVAHELFHGLQESASSYQYDGPGAWYWEATASWMEHVVFPNLGPSNQFFPGLAFRPELPIHSFLYPSTGSWEEYHQYAAELFVSHLDERYGGQALIQRSWTEAPFNADPLAILDGLIDTTIEEAFTTFAQRNATLDYAFRDDLIDAVDAYGGLSAEDSHRPTRVLFDYTPDPIAPDDFLPQTFGANYIELRSPPVDSRLNLTLDPGPEWRAALVSRTGSEHLITPFEFNEQGMGWLPLEQVRGSDEAWLVLSATNGLTIDERGYSYQLTLTRGEATDTGGPGEPERVRRCACSSASPQSSLLGLLALSLVFMRRRKAA